MQLSNKQNIYINLVIICNDEFLRDNYEAQQYHSPIILSCQPPQNEKSLNMTVTNFIIEAVILVTKCQNFVKLSFVSSQFGHEFLINFD